jgi:signal peptidase I
MSNKKRIPIILACVGAAGILVLIAAKIFFIGYYRIPQNGMCPNLPAGSIIFTTKRAYAGASSVKRGDIIVFVREENGYRYNVIWRIVGLPGEKVDAFGEMISINNHPVQRQRVREVNGQIIFREQIDGAAYEVAIDNSVHDRPPDTSMIVPPDQFFVMGDNRFKALDSRYFGPIPFRSIIGKKL